MDAPTGDEARHCWGTDSWRPLNRRRPCCCAKVPASCWPSHADIIQRGDDDWRSSFHASYCAITRHPPSYSTLRDP